MSRFLRLDCSRMDRDISSTSLRRRSVKYVLVLDLLAGNVASLIKSGTSSLTNTVGESHEPLAFLRGSV